MPKDDMIVVNRKDLVELLNYSQPDEEDDFIDNQLDQPGADPGEVEHHIVHAIRRLREQSESPDGWPIDAQS